MKKAFTMIELLIVMAIMGVLATFILTNVSGARARARDARAKTELDGVKTALGLYQTIYAEYPSDSRNNGLYFYACGANGNEKCPQVGCDADFAVGSGGCSTVLMQKMTRSGQGFFFKYYPCNSGTDYRLKITLENVSDHEIAESQAKCPAAACGLGTYGSSEFIACP